MLTLNNLESLAIGSAILGSGGGGDPAYDVLMTKYQIEKHGPVELITIDQLKPDDLVAPIGFMGAPLISLEKIPSGREFLHLIAEMEKHLCKRPTVLMPAEIGGANAFTPIMAAAQLRLPLLDADTLGRAFPELQMSSCNLHKVSPSPAFLSDCLGNTVVLNVDSCHTLEKMARHVTVAMGSSSALSTYIMSGTQAATSVIPNSISYAIGLGKALLEARAGGHDPIQAVIDHAQGVRLGSGKITDIDQVVTEGFLNGFVEISNKEQILKVEYQNEYLIARQGNSILATTPDIIMLLEQDTGTPITSESLRYGLRVELIALPAPTLWQTPEGLSLVGPRYFGYNIDYQPIGGLS